MKDLLCFTADADASGWMKSILSRHQALGIRQISFDVDRHVGRDSGMVQSGSEILRMKKGQYSKVLMMFDHHGSGQEHHQSSSEIEQKISEKLDRYSWSENHCVTVLVPELEEWLWYSPVTIANYYGISLNQWQDWAEAWARSQKMKQAEAEKSLPKEMFEYLVRHHLKKTISPRNFQNLGEKASISPLTTSPSFQVICQALQGWFPQV